jgi:hypothetical protein
MFSKLASWVTKSSEQFGTVVSTIPTHTVEEIHKAFDKAEVEVLGECAKVLAELKIPTETQLEKKAQMMREIGFVASETIEQAKVLRDKSEEIKKERDAKKLVADTINEFRVSYPKEKFITEDKLNKLCKKYNLMYAPIKNYIKDVPEKNLLDIKTRKSLQNEDACQNVHYFTGVLYDWSSSMYERDYYCPGEIPSEHLTISDTSEYLLEPKLKEKLKELGYNKKEIHFTGSVKKTVTKNGLFVAAPKSHFNLDGISKENEFGFFDVKHVEVKDPIVFEFCKNGMVRIITKWGTEDDQSYLDPIVQNPTDN